MVVVPISVPVPVSIPIRTLNTRRVRIAIVIGYDTGVRRYGTAIGVLRNVRVGFNQALTLIRIRIAVVGIVGSGRAISIVGSAAAR